MTYSPYIELTEIQALNCCLGKLGEQRSGIEQAGNEILWTELTEKILALENIVEALCDYDESSDTNILTSEEVEKLIETGHKFCGCCSENIDDISSTGLSTPSSCNLNNLQVAIFDCGGGNLHALVVDRYGNVALKKYRYTYEGGDEDLVWTVLSTGIGILSQIFDIGTYFYLRVTIECPNNSDKRLVIIDKSSDYLINDFAFNNFLFYKINGGSAKPLVNGSVWVSALDIIEIYNGNTDAVQASFVSQLYGAYIDPDTHTFNYADFISSPYSYHDIVDVTYRDNSTYPDNTCTLQKTFTVSFVPDPVISGTSAVCPTGFPMNLTCNYGENTSVDYDSYQWYLFGVKITGETSKVLSVLAVGVYKCMCVKNDVIVSSANFVVTEAAAPQPVLFVENIGDKYTYFQDDSNVFVPSTYSQVALSVVDTGYFSGGYPAGTMIDLVGYTGPVPYNLFFTDGYNMVTSSGGYTVRITLPVGSGGCATDSNIMTVDFSALQTAQITPDESCVASVLDALVFTVTDMGGGVNEIETNGITVCNGNDYSVGATWSVLLGSANITIINPLKISVDGPGVFGFVSTDPTMTFGSFFIVINP